MKKTNTILIILVLVWGCKKEKIYTTNKSVVWLGQKLNTGDTLKTTEGHLFSNGHFHKAAYKKVNDTLYEVIYRKCDTVQ